MNIRNSILSIALMGLGIITSTPLLAHAATECQLGQTCQLAAQSEVLFPVQAEDGTQYNCNVRAITGMVKGVIKNKGDFSFGSMSYAAGGGGAAGGTITGSFSGSNKGSIVVTNTSKSATGNVICSKGF